MAVELDQMFWVFILEILYSEKGKARDVNCYMMEFLEFIFTEAFFLPDPGVVYGFCLFGCFVLIISKSI